MGLAFHRETRRLPSKGVRTLEHKIKQDEEGIIGKNIREARLAIGIGQTGLVRCWICKGYRLPGKVL